MTGTILDGVPVGLAFTAVVIAALIAGARGQRWLTRRRLDPGQQEIERLADTLLRLARHLPAVAHDPPSGRQFRIQRRLAIVAIGVLEADEHHNPAQITTWYLVTRWGSPTGIARVLRHQTPNDQTFEVATRNQAETLIALEAETGALGAHLDELAELAAQLGRAIPI